MSKLRTAVAAGESGPLITMSGEADLTDASQLREVIAAQLADGAVYLTIDVAGLTYADSGAISILWHQVPPRERTEVKLG